MKTNLDVLRAIAVSAVLADHVILYLSGYAHPDLGPFSPLRLGRFGVLIFFVHTCFVLLQSLERDGRMERATQALRFYIRRVFRIYPLVWVVIVACCLIHIPIAPNVRYSSLGGFAVLANLFLFQNIVSLPSMIGPLWSLPYEMQMYLVLPFLFWATRLRSRWLMIAAGYAACASISLWGSKFGLRGGFLLDYVPCFLAGGIAFVLESRVRPRLASAFWPLLILATGLAFASVPELAPGEYKAASWALCMILGLSLPLFKDFRSALITRPAKLIAKYSYGLYVAHIPVIWGVVKLLPHADASVKILIALGVSAGVSVFLYHAIEEPMIQLGRRLATFVELGRALPAVPVEDVVG